jgi:hypothetical protein
MEPDESLCFGAHHSIAPAELEREARGRPLSVNLMDKKSEDYVPPPKVITPFAGAGQRLGGYACVPS